MQVTGSRHKHRIEQMDLFRLPPVLPAWDNLPEECREDTLLIDEATVYDSRQGNDRLLLGLKGSLNEYELDLFKHRSQAARKQKALRGELGMNTPVGYVNPGDGLLEEDPDRTRTASRST